MKKILCLLVLILSISACSFIIDTKSSVPKSTHIPSIDTGRSVFSTLKGTIWKSDSYSADQDTYLYIDEYEDKYAIEYEKKGVKPERYPADYEYISLGRQQDLPPSPLKCYDTVLFNRKYNRNQFIGFHLKNSFLLYTAESTGSTIELIQSLESGTGNMWKLYNY